MTETDQKKTDQDKPQWTHVHATLPEQINTNPDPVLREQGEKRPIQRQTKAEM